MNKLTFKNSIYCYARFLGYQLIYGIVIGIPLMIFLAILSSCDLFSSFTNYTLSPFDVLSKIATLSVLDAGADTSPIWLLAIAALLIIPSFFIIKLSLKKVFFEPYKHFSIKPYFKNKVPNKFLWIVTLLPVLVPTIIDIIIMPESLINNTYISFLLSNIVVFFILKYIIEKNTTVSNTKKPIITEILH